MTNAENRPDWDKRSQANASDDTVCGSVNDSGLADKPLLALAALGFFLFDTGYHFARPVLTNLSPALDIVQLAGQAAITFATLLLALRPTSTGAFHLNQAASLSCVIFCLLAQITIITAPNGLGLFHAYVGTALTGLGFGACFLAWVALFSQRAQATPSCLALLGALATSRVADTLIRYTLPPNAWMPLGFCLVDVSLVLLIILVPLARQGASQRKDNCPYNSGFETASNTQSENDSRHSAPADSPAESKGSVVAGLVGATLFSAFFGLITQIHNISQGTTLVPDYLSCLITLLLFIPLAIFLIRSTHLLRLGDLFLVTLPIMAGILMAVALLQDGVLDVADASVKTLFNVYFAATLIFLVQHRAKGSALTTGMLLGVWLGVLVGSIAGFATASLTELGTTTITAVALAAIWLCTLASSFVARSAAQRAERIKAGDPATPQGNQPEVHYIDRRDEQVQRLAQTYGLSARETQIVSIFAQGRSAARIAEQLTLSENTVKTHLQNSYAKAGVHSKQELLDLIARQ